MGNVEIVAVCLAIGFFLGAVAQELTTTTPAQVAPQVSKDCQGGYANGALQECCKINGVVSCALNVPKKTGD